MNITAKTKICVIIGDPIEHSLSPSMHNACYEALGIDNEYIFVASKVKIEDVKDVIKAVRVMGLRGLTCTIPHKTEVMKYLDEIDPIAKKIGAVNTVVNDSGILKGYNTDWIGTVSPIEKLTSLKDKKVALIGAGGAARAMAYGVLEKGATLTIFNRTREKAELLVEGLGDNVQLKSWEEIEREIPNQDIILNATSLGMGNQKEETPIPKECISKHHIVFDAVYSPRETRLLREAKAKGATVIYGVEMLLHQGTAQFELYTLKEAPVDVMRSVLK